MHNLVQLYTACVTDLLLHGIPRARVGGQGREIMNDLFNRLWPRDQETGLFEKIKSAKEMNGDFPCAFIRFFLHEFKHGTGNDFGERDEEELLGFIRDTIKNPNSALSKDHTRDPSHKDTDIKLAQVWTASRLAGLVRRGVAVGRSPVATPVFARLDRREERERPT